MKEFSVSILASGSRGNSILVSSPSTSILVDAGLTGKKTLERLSCLDFEPGRLSAILVTHEHGDHVNGVGVLARRLSLPVYATKSTFAAARKKLGELPERRLLYKGRPLVIGDLTIHPFPTFHDAAEAVAFVIEHAGSSLGIMTDIGHVSSLARQKLMGCSTVILESNYCPDMLMKGPYPWSLKQRIKGRNGHLSNRDACRLIAELAPSGLRRVVLSHLSEENNSPEAVMRALVDNLPPNVMEATEFHISGPDRATPLLPV